MVVRIKPRALDLSASLCFIALQFSLIISSNSVWVIRGPAISREADPLVVGPSGANGVHTGTGLTISGSCP